MRTDNTLFNMDAEPANSSHVAGPELLRTIVEQLEPTDPASTATIRKFAARLTAYAFLENCDARTAVCDTGPYDLRDGTFLALRELCCDGHGDFPWLDGIRESLPDHDFVLAYRLPNSVTMDNNVWGTAWFAPADYLSEVIEARVFAVGDGELRPLSLVEVVEMTGHIRTAHRKLYARLADTDPEERNLYATQMYSWKLKAWSRIAGCYDEIDWAISPSITDSYQRFRDPAVALGLIGGVFVPADRDSCFRPIGENK